MLYKERIATLISTTPFHINPNIVVSGRPPSLASSEFLTNKEQGDWAEEVVLNAINDMSKDYYAVHYGRDDSLAAGDEGFDEFYQEYQNELNYTGKKPDLLIYKRSDVNNADIDFSDDELVKKAVAAIEVRSSSFLANRYSNYMESRTNSALEQIHQIKRNLLAPRMYALLNEKSPKLCEVIANSTDDTFCEIDFRLRTWSSTPELQKLTKLLKDLKTQIMILQKRSYLSITPKIEDLALVNRWIQRYNIKHYYLQVFFDKAYVIPFSKILEIASDPAQEGNTFSIEEDVKNQGKTTIKINVKVGREIIGRIDMPEHQSAMKELERGRLLFYVTFKNGYGYLDNDVFMKTIIENE